MSEYNTSSTLTPENLREQARRARQHARHLAGDPAADRLLDFADQLEAQAEAMDEPTVRLSPTSAAVLLAR
jgi:molecular chaperone GrpE (heat shock protein)